MGFVAAHSHAARARYHAPQRRRRRNRIAGKGPLLAVSASLLQRVAANDAAAVRECIDAYGGLVWSLARRFCPTPSEAEDAVQEIFVNLWRSAGRFDPTLASEPTFVSMIARRRLIDRARVAQRRPDAEPLAEDAARAAPPRTDLTEDAAKAARAVAALPSDQQRILRFSIVQGLSHQQIADAMNLPLGTVKTHIRRALVHIRELLTPHADQEVVS